MTTFIYLTIYLLLLAYITWISSKKQNINDFLNSSKKLTGKEITWTTFASLLTGYNFVMGVTFSFLFGLWYLLIFIGAALAFVFLFYFYKSKLQSLQEHHNLFSLGDYFEFKYGKSTRFLTNIILILSLLLFLVLQIFINTQLFSGLLGITKIAALVITVGVVCLYLWFGGFKTSVKTDILQGILMLPIILTVFYINPGYDNTGDFVNKLFPLNQFWFAIGLLISQFLSLIAQAESFQRIYAVSSVKDLKTGLKYSFLLLCLVAGAIAYIGISLKLTGTTIDPNNLFIEAVLTSLPKWLSSLLVVSLVAAFMGTIDSSAFALGSILSNPINKDKKAVVFRMRFYITISMIVSAIMSIYLFSFLSSVFALISLISLVGSAVLFSFVVNSSTAKDINALLVVGILVFLCGIFFKFITDNPITILIPSISGLIIATTLYGFRANNKKIN